MRTPENERSRQVGGVIVDVEDGRRSRQSQQRKVSPWRWLTRIGLGLISALFAAFFAYIAVTQVPYRGEDIQWIVFYSLNTALPVFFILCLMGCFPVNIVSFLAMIINIWSIVYIVMTWISRLSTTSLTLTALYASMVSTIYHSLAMRCCLWREPT